MPDGVGSHIPVLEDFFKAFPISSVFEYGTGLHSTPFFATYVRFGSVTSVEMDNAEWYDRVSGHIASNSLFNVNLLLMEGPDVACDYLENQANKFDLVFVDGHIDRWKQINAAFNKTDIIFAHDTEDAYCYHWENVKLPLGWQWIELVRSIPRTSVISCRPEVIAWAKKRNADTPIFEPLRQHAQIVVTGPVRSGTRICAEMIAHDFGYQLLHEEDIWDQFFRLVRLNMELPPTVYQVPAIAPWCHKLAWDVAVVFLVRDPDEIRASLEEIQWGETRKKQALQKYYREEGDITDVIYDVWRRYQRVKIKYDYEIPYAALSKHPMWVPAEKRVGWQVWQTKI